MVSNCHSASADGRSSGNEAARIHGEASVVWSRAVSPGHDELRYVFFLINGTVMRDHFREQVASTPLGAVRSSLPSGTDLGESGKSVVVGW